MVRPDARRVHRFPTGVERRWKVQIVFNTTDGQKAVSDSKSLRRATLMQKVPYYTTLSGAAAVAEAIAALRAGNLEVRPLQEYFG